MRSSKAKMSFVCKENWDNMEFKANGRHCLSCNQTVKDFSSLSKKDFKNQLETNTSLCGRFAPHQVDTSLIPIDDLLPKKKFAFASILLFLGFSSIKAQTIDSVQTEQVDAKKPSCHGDSDELSDDDKKHERWKRKFKRRRKAIKNGWCIDSRGTTYHYVSWRFPFIFKQRRTMGKFR